MASWFGFSSKFKSFFARCKFSIDQDFVHEVKHEDFDEKWLKRRKSSKCFWAVSLIDCPSVDHCPWKFYRAAKEVSIAESPYFFALSIKANEKKIDESATKVAIGEIADLFNLERPLVCMLSAKGQEDKTLVMVRQQGDNELLNFKSKRNLHLPRFF